MGKVIHPVKGFKKSVGLKEFIISVKEFKSMKPIMNDESINRYYCYTSIFDVPLELRECVIEEDAEDIPDEDYIAMLLQQKRDEFHLLAPGIVINAKEVTFDNRKNKVNIILEDEGRHGVIRGANTLRAIFYNRSQFDANIYIELELISDMSLEEVEMLVNNRMLD